MKATLLLILGLLPMCSVGQPAATLPPDSMNTVGFNNSISGLPTFDRILVETLGEYYFQGRAGKIAPDKAYVQQQLTILKRDLTNYYVLGGRFKSNLLNTKSLDDTSRYKVPTEIRPLPIKATQPPPAPHTTFAYPADSSLMAVATATQLTLKRVKPDTTAIGQPLPIANAVFGFSTQKELYAANQIMAADLKRIDSQGRITVIPLPSAFPKRHYRIDQLLPDDSLMLTRHISGGKTYIEGWNFRRTKPALVFSDSLPYLINGCKLTLLMPNRYLLSAYRVNDQRYSLFLTPPRFSGKLIPVLNKPVNDFKVDTAHQKLVLRTADDSLLLVDPENLATITPIAGKARYFAIQGNALVYWQQRSNPDQWALRVNSLIDGRPIAASREFWYDTDLRRDVPRLTVEGNRIRFDDYSNNTTNYVSLTKQPMP